MIRLLGVLVGSALAVVALVVFIGIPEFTATTSVTEETVITLPMRPETVAEAEPAVETMPPVDGIDDTVAGMPEEPGAQPSETDVEVLEESPSIEPDELYETESIESLRQWYAFWSPFRSEIAAAGFVDQLQRVTGLDYRIVKIKPGVYEVAFAYSDDDEITFNLSQISAATGLNLAVN